MQRPHLLILLSVVVVFTEIHWDIRRKIKLPFINNAFSINHLNRAIKINNFVSTAAHAVRFYVDARSSALSVGHLSDDHANKFPTDKCCCGQDGRRRCRCQIYNKRRHLFGNRLHCFHRSQLCELWLQRQCWPRTAKICLSKWARSLHSIWFMAVQSVHRT